MFYSATSTIQVTELFKVPQEIKIKDQMEEFRRIVRNCFNKRNVLYLNMGISASYNVATKSIPMPSFLHFAFRYTLIENWIHPVFVYIEIEAINISLKKRSEVISRSVYAIHDVHAFGNPFDIKVILGIGEDYNALLIEDCAYASYSKYMEYPVGVLEVYSFFPIYKYFPAMEEEFHITAREKENGSMYENEKIEKKPFFRFIYIIDVFNPLIFMIIVRESSSYRKKPQRKCSPLYISICKHFFIKIKVDTTRKNRVCNIYYRGIIKSCAYSWHNCCTIIFEKIGFPDAIKAASGIIMLSVYPSYSDAILRLLEDEELRARLIGNALEFVRDYSWDEITTRYEEMYRRVLEAGA